MGVTPSGKARLICAVFECRQAWRRVSIGPVLKRFRLGTHRTTAPEETLARVADKARQIGVTRLGNVTGLDRIGIPVTVAVRPNSRSVSVSQGKGLGLSQALASAIMEAIELFHGEDLTDRTVASKLPESYRRRPASSRRRRSAAPAFRFPTKPRYDG